ncbi:hypothetical protein TSAR_011480, partial [Trichomalopsis sarcophagae]
LILYLTNGKNNLNWKILRWICRSINNKLDFEKVASQFDIILLGFETVRFDRCFNKGGGLAICIKNGIIFERNLIELGFKGNSLEIGAVTVDSNLGKILFTVCYRAPKFIDTIKQHGRPSFSNIDLTFASLGLDFVSDWQVLEDKWGSRNQKCIWRIEDCTKAVRLRKAAQLCIKHRFTIEIFIEVKRTEALLRKTLKDEKMK